MTILDNRIARLSGELDGLSRDIARQGKEIDRFRRQVAATLARAAERDRTEAAEVAS
ncbi:putative coiled-coil protein SlyX [Rhodovulum sulfidophilum]|uniref:hypothetical protein n=1 Tax=Rhodovulum sulfidophilum TaxID=35806 RepID=UPI0012DA863C|nr:hypothetical protein [Rhodovulum sulfidophilum]MCW2305105.1 putative coiled-coil protein SlyX [Rhodovulum sulfidophilum]